MSKAVNERCAPGTLIVEALHAPVSDTFSGTNIIKPDATKTEDRNPYQVLHYARVLKCGAYRSHGQSSVLPQKRITRAAFTKDADEGWLEPGLIVSYQNIVPLKTFRGLEYDPLTREYTGVLQLETGQVKSIFTRPPWEE